LNNKIILFAWITGLLAAIAALWIITQPVQARFLLQAINTVLAEDDERLKLASPIEKPHGKPGMLGYWYSTADSKDIFFVFGIFSGGILIPCGAIVSDSGEVKEIIPLGVHSRQFIENVHENIIKMHIHRIEENGK
jgi:hypothetical protein